MPNLLGSVGSLMGNKLVLNAEVTAATNAEICNLLNLVPTDLDLLGNTGTAAKWECVTGKQYTLTIKATKCQTALFIHDGKIQPILLKSGTGEIAFTANNNFYGLAILRNYESSSEISLDTLSVNELKPPISPLQITKLGSGAKPDFISQIYSLQTQGGISVETLSRYLGTNLNGIGANASCLIINGLENGLYSYNLDVPIADEENMDQLLAYNGAELVTLADTMATIETQIIVPFGWVALIAANADIKEGNTQFIVSNLTKTAELTETYTPPISLIPSLKKGNVKLTDYELIISSGSGSLTRELLNPELPFVIPEEIVEGSYASFDIPDGNYTITYSIRSSDLDTAKDAIYFYNGTEILFFDDRSTANIPNASGTTFTSPIITENVAINGGKLGFLVGDTLDKAGTTEMRILSLKKS